MTEQIMQTIAKHEERLDFHGKRIERTEDLIVQIHKLSSGVENLTDEVRKQNSRIEKLVINIDKRIKSQGERIGDLEKKGSKKLESIITTALTVIITAVIVYFMSHLGIEYTGF